MNAMMNEKGRQTKLLAAIAVLAMVVCVFAAIMPSETNAAETSVPEAADGVITLIDDTTVDSMEPLNGVDLDLAGYTLTVKTMIVAINSDVYSSEAGGKIATSTQSPVIQLQGNSSINGVTLEYTSTEYDSSKDTAIVDVSAGANVTISDCEITGAGSSTAVYTNYAPNTTTNVTIQDCDVSADGVTMKEIIWDGPSTGSMDVSNSTGVRLNFTYSNAGAETAEITIGDQVTITDTAIDRVNIDAASTIIVPENETLSASTIRGAGNLQVDEGGYVEGIVTVTGYTNDNPRVGLTGQMINFGVDNLPISGNLYVAEELTINEGKTLTIQSGAILDLNGKTITIEGTLVIEDGAEVINSATTGSIILAEGGVLDNNGTVGAGSIPVKVGVNTTSYVEMLNVSGVSFTVNTNDSEESSDYTLQVSGETYAAYSGITHELTLNNVEIAGNMVLGSDVDTVITGTVDVIDSATLTIDGALDITTENAKLVMKAGSTVAVNAAVDGAITAETGKFQNVVDQKPGKATGTSTVRFDNGVDYVVGITLTVSSVGTFENVNGERTAFTEQSLLVSGDADLVTTADNEDLTGELTIVNSAEADNVQAGISYVAEGATLNLAEGISVEGGNTVVQGTIQYKHDSKIIVEGFYGTERSVGTANERTVYITTFEVAYADIANAYDGLKVYGDLEITIDVDLQSKQKISFETSGAEITVAEEAEVTANSGSSIGKITTVEGILTKYNGANCPVPDNYAVKKTGDNYTQYAGLAAALATAVAGETIKVVNNTDVDGNLAIPADVTLSVKSGVTVSIDGNLTVPETSKVANSGTIQMVGKTSKITVAGELDSSKGTLSFGTVADDVYTADTTANAQKALTSTGTTILAAKTAGNNAIINASGATFVKSVNTILTTLSKAADSMKDASTPVITMVGNVTDRTDVTVPADVTVEFEDGSKAVLGTLTLSEGSVINMIGTNVEVTATVTAAVGAEGSEVASSVDVSKASGITFGIVPYIAADNTTTTYLVMDGAQSGSVTVSAGNVYVDEYTANGCTLTVASGATLGVQKIGTSVIGELTVGVNKTAAALVVDGTIAVDEGTLQAYSTGSGTPTYSEIIDVNGTMTVSNATVAIEGTINVNGTVDVQSTEDEPASLAVNGKAYVSGTVNGPVTTAGYLVVYPEANIAAAEIDMESGESLAESTAFYINGEVYMTVYSSGSNDLETILGAEDFSMSGYKTTGITTITNWYMDSDLTDKIEDGDTTDVGNPEAVYYKASPMEVDVKISVGAGISLYIDGIRYSQDTTLTVGTHTVSATINPGYTGDITIQFNGQAVTDSFTITPEMASLAYEGTVSVSASGNISVDSGATGGDDGMGLTEILLIILVVLIVIMAIMVALRLMRS